jgi:hypothetical protein
MRASIVIVLILAGCDPLASSDYVGQPVFTLAGTFDTRSTMPDSGGGIALMWQDASGPGGPGVAATAVPVTLEAPASFHVSVPVPPPDAARFSFADGPQLAEAYVFFVADPSASRLVPLGSDRAHALIFAAADVAAGTSAADYLGGPVSAGYHLRQFAPVATPGTAQATMIDRCVSSGAAPDACQIRRAYALSPIGDDDPLRIVVSSP